MTDTDAPVEVTQEDRETWPTKPGYYWATLRRPTGEGNEDWCSGNREIVEVHDNNGEGDETFSVSVFGVPITQWLPNFEWHGPVRLTTEARKDAEIERLRKSSLEGVWMQARENHARYSATGSVEEDIRFHALGLTGEAGEVANFVKKRWRDGDSHNDDLKKECADVLAYTMMLAEALGMSPADLIAMVAHKQQVFIDKMQARAALSGSK